MVNPIEVIKQALDVVDKVRDAKLQADLVQKIISLQQITLSQDQEIRRLTDECDNLKKQLQAKQDQAELLAQFERRGNAYYRKGDKDVAYCVACLEGGEARSLIDAVTLNGEGRCPHCNATYPNVFEQVPMRIHSAPTTRFSRRDWQGL